MELIAYYLIKILAFVFRLLPQSLALLCGRAIGLIGYRFDSKEKRIAYNNLRIAFSHEKSDQEIRKILKQCYIHYGQNIVELSRLPLTGKKGYRDIVKVEGKDNVDKAIARGKGVIFLAIHSGNWELSSVVGSMVGHPYNLVAHPQKRTPILAKLLMSYRKSAGAKIITTGDDTRAIIRCLKANEIITLVADQGGKEGQLVNFFGREASMSTGAIRLAMKYGAAICLVDIYRTGHGQHCLKADEPIVMVSTGDDQADLTANLENIVKRFEDKIREHPHEYMWFYKIWKYSRNSHVVILDDGRTGHLRQSQSLAAIVVRRLLSKEKIVQEQTVLIEFKNLFARKLAVLISFIGGFIPQFRSVFWLKVLLSPQSFAALMSVKADYIISCGSMIAGIHFLSVPWQMAKSFVLLKPGLIPWKRFDLLVIPQHDILPSAVSAARKNVVITKAALNLVNDRYMKQQSQLLLNRFSHLKNSYRTKIGVLLGGNAKHVEFTEPVIKMVIHQLKEIALQLNADILLTTSRRTPESVEQLIWRELKKFERCPLLISATQSNIPEAVGGILGLSDYVVVSSESISMISEAVSSGKKTVVFRVNAASHEFKRNKYEKFVDRLNEQGYLRACSVKDLGATLYGVMRDKVYFKTLNDQQLVQQAVEQII